jgi:hypothetical protein
MTTILNYLYAINVTLTYAIPTAAVYRLFLKETGSVKNVLRRSKNKKSAGSSLQNVEGKQECITRPRDVSSLRKKWEEKKTLRLNLKVPRKISQPS